MDTALQAIFSWNFLLFSLTIFTIIWIIRSILEYFAPKLTTNMLWSNLILPIAPVFVGAITAYEATQYPFPDGLTSISARLMFGTVSGMFSGLVYQVAKGMLKNTIQQYINGTVIGQIVQPAPLPPAPLPPIIQPAPLPPMPPVATNNGMGTGQP